ncbi:MAG: ParB/RepB/Spo0J family partition protein [Bacteroidales bacterium]|jgi:ParB family chromosome partitioning protein|nr:ParB/RepB/Spo0J family partition protein [Bacteroidales bacterium]
MSKKQAMGRGLDAILGSPDTDITSKDISGNYVVGAVAELPMHQIDANPFQPRSDFEDESLMELSDSIQKQGIIQPITVRKMGLDKYQLIAGERRLRAAKMAGFKNIPAFLRVANDEQMLEMALVENIQRENLNAIEIAISYTRLIEECKITQEELSTRVGKKRSTVTNYIRLLKLPAEIQISISQNQISMGHARALINVENLTSQLKILEQVVARDLSVRETENLVKDLINPIERIERKKDNYLPSNFISYRSQLNNLLSTRVDIKRNTKGGGKISIPYSGESDLLRIIALLEK